MLYLDRTIRITISIATIIVWINRIIVWNKGKTYTVEANRVPRIKTIFTFQHINGTIENCTKYELKQKYNLEQGGLSRLCAGEYKSTQGWSIV